MTKHKTLPLLWTAVSLLLLFLGFDVIPGLTQSRTTDAAQPVNPDTLFNCTWSGAAVYPIPVLDNAVTAVGGNIYSFAGISNGAIIAASYKFDGTTWMPIAPVPAAVEFPAAVTDGTNIYVLGGADTTLTPTTTLYRYDVAANTYTTLAPFTTGTWNHAAVYLNGKIYKFAGTGPATNSTNVLEIYDVASNTWTLGANYPLSTSFASGFTQGNFIYAAGGITVPGLVVTAKTYRYDPATNTWNDAAIADLPVTRWGAASALYTDEVLAGGYVGGAATANISTSAISWDIPSNTWQNASNMLGERARMAGGVLNGSFYVVGGRSIASSGFVGTNDNQKLLCFNGPGIGNGGSSIVVAGPDGVLDPGEVVTVALGALNTGGPGVVCTTAALTGTLQATGGVTSPSAPQNYGMLCSGSPAVFRNFTFTVDPALPCGSTVTASLVITDGATNYGTLTYAFTTGNLGTSFTENFDGVVAPALPAGWVATNAAGAAPLWVTSTTTPDSTPNDAFIDDPAAMSDKLLDTPGIGITSANAQVRFRNNYALEPIGGGPNFLDGGVLEVSSPNINGGAFTDIADAAAGGSFVTGGYNGTIATGLGNPLAGRMAWSQSSGGYINTVANLGPNVNGHTITLRFRMGSDNNGAGTGWRIDNLSILTPVCGGSVPAVSSAVSRKTHGAAGPFNINLPLVALGGAVGIEDRSGAVAGEHQMVVTFASPVTVGSAAVTTGTGSVDSSNVAGAVVTINLTGVANAQRLGVTLGSVSDGTNLGSVMIPMGVLIGRHERKRGGQCCRRGSDQGAIRECGWGWEFPDGCEFERLDQCRGRRSGQIQSGHNTALLSEDLDGVVS